MSNRWTLPLLQGALDTLEPGARFRLEREEMARLFGLNSAAVGRVANFAQGHSCDVIFTAGDILFHKNGGRRQTWRGGGLLLPVSEQSKS